MRKKDNRKDFSSETLLAKRYHNESLKCWKQKICQSRIKISFETEDEMQIASIKILEIGHIFDRQQRKCSPAGSTAKTRPAMQETQVWPLGQQDPWKRTWQPTPVLLPGESHGRRSLEDHGSRGRRAGHSLLVKQRQQQMLACTGVFLKSLFSREFPAHLY